MLTFCTGPNMFNNAVLIYLIFKHRLNKIKFLVKTLKLFTKTQPKIKRIEEATVFYTYTWALLGGQGGAHISPKK